MPLRTAACSVQSAAPRFLSLRIWLPCKNISWIRTSRPFLLATAVHIVKLVSRVFVLAFTAIELISLPVVWAHGQLKLIVAIPAVEDILTRASRQRVVAVAPIQHVIAL